MMIIITTITNVIIIIMPTVAFAQ